MTKIFRILDKMFTSEKKIILPLNYDKKKVQWSIQWDPKNWTKPEPLSPESLKKLTNKILTEQANGFLKDKAKAEYGEMVKAIGGKRKNG